MKCGVETKVAVIISVWIDRRQDISVWHVSDPESKAYKYRACVRQSNGSLEWHWTKTKKEAEIWVNAWITKKG